MLLSIAFTGVRITIEKVTKQYTASSPSVMPQTSFKLRPPSLSLSSNRFIFPWSDLSRKYVNGITSMIYSYKEVVDTYGCRFEKLTISHNYGIPL